MAEIRGSVSLIESEQGKPYDHVRSFLASIPEMVGVCRYALTPEAPEAQGSHSYRRFRVEGTIYAINAATRSFMITSAGNLKREHQMKVCAEKKLANKCLKDGMTEAVGLVVVATADIDKIEEVNDYPTPTLHMCRECRIMGDEHPLFTDHTLVVSTGIDWDVNQAYTFGSLRKAYQQADRGLPAEELYRSNLDFNNWDLRLDLYDRLVEMVPDVATEERAHLAHIAMTSTVS